MNVLCLQDIQAVKQSGFNLDGDGYSFSNPNFKVNI